MKKIIYILFMILIATCSVSIFLGCDSCNNPSNEDNQNVEVALNAYLVELNIGDTFEFKVNKFINGRETSAKDIKIKSDVNEIVSINGKTIKALAAGATYIHFNVDGFKAACYVNVLDDEVIDVEEAKICFSSKNLYNGLNSQAQAYVYDSGKYIVPEGIVWSIVGDGTVDEFGVVTPNGTQTTLVVKVDFSHGGKAYSITKTIDVLAPIYCVPSTYMIKLMGQKTPTGISVGGTNSSTVSFSFINFLTDTEIVVDNVDFTYDLSNDVVEVEKVDDKTARIIGKNCGVSTISFKVNGFDVFVGCQVAVPISTPEEFLSLENSKLTSSSVYALANDITIKVNGTYNSIPGDDDYDVSKGVESGSDACWKKDINGTYCVISRFSGRLNGNGHKITIQNTTPFNPTKTSSFAGVFNNIEADAIIENVVFDIQIKKSNFFISGSFSSLIYKLEGVLKNCYIKTTINGNAIGENSAVVRTITKTSTLSNNIYIMDGKIATVSRDIKYAIYNEKQIIVGASQSMFTAGDSKINAKLDNAVYYNSVEELLNASNYGKSYIALYKVTTSDGGHNALEVTSSTADYYHLEPLTSRNSPKLEFDENWTFDYAHGVLKLCGQTVAL